MTSSDDLKPPSASSHSDESDAATFVENRTAGRSARQSTGLYELLVDSVMDYAIFALDPNGYILTWNSGAQRIKGYAPQEIIGKHFSIFYPPEKVAEGFPDYELREAARTGRFEDEGWRIRKDGSRFWANVVITALRDETGKLVGFAKVTRDLSERRASEEALRQSEERFRLIVQSVKDYAIFMLDPKGRVATWNEGAEAINGYTAAEIIGKHFSIFHPEPERSAGKPDWELEVAEREGQIEDEGWRVRKDGTQFWADVVITALFSSTGRLVGFTKVTRDLTDRKRADERAMSDARRIAAVEASSKVKSEFLATLSHELRTPLNAVGGYAELLELGVAGPVTDRQREYLGRIRDSQHHLLRLINDLLNYSRIEAGHVHYDIGPVPLHALLDRALLMVTPQATAKRIEMVHGPCDERAEAVADAAKVEQIALNLLSNAVKFTPEGGRVTTRCSAANGEVSLSIIDTGPGVPPERRAEIFEPFVQLGRTLNAPAEGTGLGLAISRDLARAMHGDLTVIGGPEGGAQFTLTLPTSSFT
ncbi:MAG TPA: PAS domain-containing sensor histidine kinase [Gemmatimonadaceae bacterium]|nr:PAS domain-containing sensor histidine kinase [Gemmatimonadaceae bacterium]